MPAIQTPKSVPELLKLIAKHGKRSVLLSGVDPAADQDLVSAAIEAVKLWRYTPTLLNCIPIEVQMKVTVNFKTE